MRVTPKISDKPRATRNSNEALASPFRVWIRREASIAEARAEIVTAIGVLEAAGAGTVLHSQVDDLDWFARELARLPWPFHVVKPDGLRAAVTSHARSLLKATKNSCQNRTHSVIL